MKVFISFITGVVAFYAFQYFPYLTLLISISIFIFLIKVKRVFLLSLFVIGILYAFIRDSETPFIRAEAEIEGVFHSEAKITSEGFSQDFKIKSIKEINTEKPLDINRDVLNIFSDREFEHGRRCRLRAEVYMPQEPLGPGAYEKPYAVFQALLDEDGMSPIETTRAEINELIKSRFPPESASFIMAITTGQRGVMCHKLKEAFNSTGLTHLLSISGTHFGLLFLLTFAIFRLMLRLLPYRLLERITLYATIQQISAILSLPVLFFYLCLSGGSIPAIRSFIMISLFLFGLLIGRKGYWLKSLIFAGLIIIVWEPTVIFDLSFLMSFSAVAFIGLFIGDRMHKRSLKDYPKNVLFVTLSATLGIAPFISYYFHRFSLISPISNLIVTPIVGFLMLPLSLIGAFSYLITDSFLVVLPLNAVSKLSIYLVKTFSAIPFSNIKIPAFPVYLLLAYYVCFLMYAVFRKRYLLIILFILILIYAISYAGSERHLTTTFLAPKGGESSVIELPDKKTIVIDTGRSGRETIAYLNYRAIREIDSLAISHGHEDHIGGIGELITNFRIHELWDNGRISYTEGMINGMRHKTLKRGDCIESTDYKLYVFHPYEGFYTFSNNEDEEENNNSVVLKVEGRKGFLFTGDIQKKAEDDIVHLGGWLKSDVLKVPHHGSVRSIHEGFFNAVSPEIAIITSKRLNPVMKKALSNSRLYLTGIDGAVKIEDKEDGLSVRLYKDFNLKKTVSFNEELMNIKRLFVVW